MTIKSAASASRWPRFLPKQFSIGALLVLMTVVACGLWWYVQPPAGTITMKQTLRATTGMTKNELTSALGSPSGVNYGSGGEVWHYFVKVSDSHEETFLVALGSDGRVTWTSLSKLGWNSYPPR
jgi:outer membrane protein assembly factor BamE (lipoprotein component of BamABCDE complex)